VDGFIVSISISLPDFTSFPDTLDDDALDDPKLGLSGPEFLFYLGLEKLSV
jgi:hypothetical protein